MQITVTELSITITAEVGSWDDREFDDAVRSHNLWDERIDLADYQITDGKEMWLLNRITGAL